MKKFLDERKTGHDATDEVHMKCNRFSWPKLITIHINFFR